MRSGRVRGRQIGDPLPPHRSDQTGGVQFGAFNSVAFEPMTYALREARALALMA
jgi:hypothetical protein